MLLKWILQVLAALLVVRFVHGLLRIPRAVRRARSDAARLDPERAVRAAWSEVREEREGRGTG